MDTLTPDECRVLGVLIEKAQTTPGQYPLSLNALLNGANQHSNRLPVTNLTESAVLTAVDGLRAKNMVREVMLSSSRVAKYRHVTRDVLDISTSDLVVLAELLLRGPQTVGELRGRASRMHPLESLEVVSNLLKNLMEREEPLVQRLQPSPGSRAERYGQLLCPELHPADAVVSQNAGETPGTPDSDLVQRIERLEADVADLRKALQRIETVLGETV
ncbi:MAG: YceH family protein [Phycisphaerales bacterium]|nr:MAG: YceH family protein [Phycisphaerales bacterium]